MPSQFLGDGEDSCPGQERGEDPLHDNAGGLIDG
jgi:hypothetical protein